MVLKNDLKYAARRKLSAIFVSKINKTLQIINVLPIASKTVIDLYSG